MLVSVGFSSKAGSPAQERLFLTATGSSDRHGALSETINLRAFIDSLPDMPSFEYSTDALSVVRLA